MKIRFLQKTPREKCLLIHKIAAKCLAPYGANILNPNYRITLHSYLCAAIFVYAYSVTLYTMYYYRNNIIFVLQTFITLGISGPVSKTCLNWFKI